MTKAAPLLFLFLTTILASLAVAGPPAFVRTVWGPPRSNSFRVNSPDTATGRYKDRSEAKMKGLLEIDLADDPATLDAASLYLELWGGHPGVANKRFTVNGKTEVALPEVGAAEENCTYSYPDVSLKLADLKRGKNAFQFTCDKGKTFWGHYLLRAAALRLTLKKTHPDLAAAGIADVNAEIVTEPRAKGETIGLSLKLAPAFAGKVARVEYHGRYVGYDENGNRETHDWHGYTKDRKPAAIIGTGGDAPFSAEWDVSMLPDQESVAVRAVVHFTDVPGITYRTAEVTVAMPPRTGTVSMHHSADLPKPFWSRAKQSKTCHIELPMDPKDIEKAQLHVAVWDGGAGKVTNYFTLNGHPVSVAGKGRHDLIYTGTLIDPTWLKKGKNEIVLLSDTSHHGIEVCLPGPALIVRRRAATPNQP